MTVHEVPVINLLTFQVWDRDRGSWTDLADKATTVTIQRGAKQNGAKVEMQVGTLEADLYGALDLRRVADLQPNSPIRVVRPPRAPAIAWDLMPSSADDSVSSKGLWPCALNVTRNGVDYQLGGGRASSYDYIQANWNNYAPDVTNVPAGSMLFASPNTYATNPTNPRPVGKFDSGARYAVRATLASDDSTIAQRVRVVIFSGTPAIPTILAQSDPIDLRYGYPYTPLDWSFTAPDVSDWNIGVVSVDELNVTTTRALFNVRISNLEIWDTGRERPEFTGRISDLSQSIEYDKSTNEKHVYTSVQAVDAVQPLANTNRSGVIAASGAGYQTWSDRIQQLAASAHVPIDAPTQQDLVVYDPAEGIYGGGGTWSDTWYQTGSVTNSGDWYIGGSGDGSYNVYRFPGTPTTRPAVLSNVVLGRNFGGLEPGNGYAAVLTVTIPKRVGVTAGTFRLGFAGGGGAMQWGDTIDVTGGTQTVAVRFSPDVKAGRVAIYQQGDIALAAGATTALTVTIKNMRVTRIGYADAYALQDVGYESSLLNHFDLACNSVGARWYVTKRGTVLFRRQEDDPQPVARFTDSAAGDLSYTDVNLAYDTRAVVNDLKLNQHGYDPSTGNTADDALTFTNDGSVARWGARAGDLDTCLYLGAPHTGDAAQRASEVMLPLRRPRYAVQSFTFNAQSNLAVLDVLELRAAIGVHYEDLRQTSRVLSLTHSITPTQWMVTVELNETRVGARFADLAAAGSGTFATFNAAHRGQSFRDYNTNPLE